MNLPIRHGAALAALTLATALGACSHEDVSFRHFRVVDATHVALYSRTAPMAILADDGSLSIDARPVPLEPAQQAQLKDFHTRIRTLMDDALATGRAGVATATTALGAVASGLASGDPDSIGRKVDAKAAEVDAAAARICVDLARLRAQQQTIATGLPAFAPYAGITADEVASCTGRQLQRP